MIESIIFERDMCVRYVIWLWGWWVMWGYRGVEWWRTGWERFRWRLLILLIRYSMKTKLHSIIIDKEWAQVAGYMLKKAVHDDVSWCNVLFAHNTSPSIHVVESLLWCNDRSITMECKCYAELLCCGDVGSIWSNIEQFWVMLSNFWPIFAYIF